MKEKINPFVITKTHCENTNYIYANENEFLQTIIFIHKLDCPTHKCQRHIFSLIGSTQSNEAIYVYVDFDFPTQFRRLQSITSTKLSQVLFAWLQHLIPHNNLPSSY